MSFTDPDRARHSDPTDDARARPPGERAPCERTRDAHVRVCTDGGQPVDDEAASDGDASDGEDVFADESTGTDDDPADARSTTAPDTGASADGGSVAPGSVEGDSVEGDPDRPASDGEADDGDSDLRSTLSRSVHVGLVGILLLVVLVATFQFYFAASGAVNQLVADRYRQIFQAGFNLVVILAAVAGLSYLGWRRR